MRRRATCRPQSMRRAASCPPTCRAIPSYRKANPADAPILILALTSDTMTVPQMYDAADSILAQKLAQVDGVGQVFVWGAAQPAVRAEVNPTLLNKLGVGLDTVRNALNAANANRPKGQVSNGTTTYIVRRYRSALHRGSVPPADRGVQQRRGGATGRCG